MTDFTISHFHRFSGPIKGLPANDPRFSNWPVVYVLNNKRQAYVGESINVLNRFIQHQQSAEKKALDSAHVIVDSKFNKSAALDLESHLVRWLAGDDQFEILNRNVGIVDADYFDREHYRKVFEEIFEEFRSLGLFTRPIGDIENLELFKLSPFKALNQDQEATVEHVVLDLIESIKRGVGSQSVIQGDPGTGKTIVGIYLMKLIADLGSEVMPEDIASDSPFAEPHLAENRGLLKDLRIGLVVPQQSLRESVRGVFKKTPGLKKSMVLTPFNVGTADDRFDLLIVDETHRLGRRANQSSGPQNKLFAEINTKLFGEDSPRFTQLDWITAQSGHQVFLLDAAQSVRPADLAAEALGQLEDSARGQQHLYPLRTQMRVEGGDDYIAYVKALLSDSPPEPIDFSQYEFRLFDDLSKMADALDAKESEVGLSRMVAGYAWEWKSKKDKTAIDIEIDGVRRKWNTVDKDWVQSPGAATEVGSIHTVQGYDLNFAGVIIGKDLRFDLAQQRLYFDAEHYFDKKGKEQSPKFGIAVTEADLLQFVVNIYVVLLTRGIRGTFVYVCDDALRERLQRYIPLAGGCRR